MKYKSYPPYLSTIGTRIRMRRKEVGLTQAELALKIDITYQTLSKIETGQSDCSISTIMNICTALNMPPDEMFEQISKIPGLKPDFGSYGRMLTFDERKFLDILTRKYVKWNDSLHKI